MAIVFRNNIGAYTGKGSRLTSLEADGNIHDLLLRVLELEDAEVGVGIDDITQSGSVITIHLSNDTTEQFALPVALFNPAGEWLNNVAYSYLDLVTVNGLGLFFVNVPHTTPSSGAFDPNAVDGEDNPLYSLLIPLPDFQVSTPVATVSGTDYTLALSDAGYYLRCTNASGCEITFPTNTAVAFPVGTEIHFRQASDAFVMFTPASGVTLNPQRTGFDTATAWRGATVTAKKVATNTWDLIGPHGELEESSASA